VIKGPEATAGSIFSLSKIIGTRVPNKPERIREIKIARPIIKQIITMLIVSSPFTNKKI
jgi:hypothetical protein